jgi:hypothetical protein
MGRAWEEKEKGKEREKVGWAGIERRKFFLTQTSFEQIHFEIKHN